MALSRAEQDAILATQIQKMLDEQAAIMAAQETSNLTSYNAVPSNRMRNVRVTGDNWKRHHYKDATGAIKTTAMRAVGTDITVTYADGRQETRAASSFRRERQTTRKTRTITVRDTGQSYFDRVAQLGAIGDID